MDVQGLVSETLDGIDLKPGEVGAEEGCGKVGGLPIIEFDKQAIVDLFCMDDVYVGCHRTACRSDAIDVCTVVDIGAGERQG